MKKLLLMLIITFAVSCSKNNEQIPVEEFDCESVIDSTNYETDSLSEKYKEDSTT